jgi:hypothetical protein
VNTHGGAIPAFVGIIAKLFYAVCFAVTICIAERNAAAYRIGYAQLYINIAVAVYCQVPGPPNAVGYHYRTKTVRQKQAAIIRIGIRQIFFIPALRENEENNDP